MAKQEMFLKELGAIRDAYELDVKQFIEFSKERKLFLVDALKAYAEWLDQEHDGKRYSVATINRKISAAKNRIRYAFKHSSAAGSLRRKYQLEEVLGAVKPMHVDYSTIPADKVLSVEEVRKLAREAGNRTIKFMIQFLVGTGVRISEMLSIKLSDLQPSDVDFVDVRVIGKRQKERIIHVKRNLIERIQKHFRGTVYLFEHDGRPFNRISVTNRIKYEALKTIHREVTAHQLRHTWAAIQIRRGRDVRAVALALGHTDPGLTAKMYSDKTLEPQEAFLDVQDAEQSHAGGEAEREES